MICFFLLFDEKCRKERLAEPSKMAGWRRALRAVNPQGSHTIWAGQSKGARRSPKNQRPIPEWAHVMISFIFTCR
jgi:hypothetical protein